MLKKFILLFFIFVINFFNIVSAQEVLKINSVVFDNSDNIFFLGACSKVQYINIKSMQLTEPNRIVFDINDAVLTKINSSWTFKNSDIKQVKVSQFTTDPNVVRVVITYNNSFNVSKLKLHRVDNNIIFSYNKHLFPQGDLRKIYSDEKSKEGYYEYTTFSKDPKLLPAPVSTTDANPYTTPQEIVAIHNAFNSQGQLAKREVVVPEDNVYDTKLKSGFYINKIDVKRGNALIRGVGLVAIEAPFKLTNPNRLIFDLPNTYVAPEIRNKEFILSDKETIKVGQNEPTRARIVVTTDNPDKFRPIYSYDSQSIFLAHDDRILGLKLFDKTVSIYSYLAKKVDDTKDVLYFTFTDPCIHSIKRLDNLLEVNLYNVSGFDHEAYKKNLSSEVFTKLRTEALPSYGIKLIIPIKNTTQVDYHQSFDNKSLYLAFVTPKDAEITQAKPKLSIIKRNPKVKTIVIDAGHGGSDVGATREGIYEKTLTLDMSQRLAKLLKQKGYNVLMVRDTDEYVSLQDRVTFAEDNDADLFISIHVNSSVTTDGYGLETHYYTPQSYDFAQIVHSEFVSAINSKDRGLFKSKFYVINHTNCPSILVETGFISNPDERKELLTTERKQKTAEALAKGIQKYLGKN